jgi:hypothetical protein
MSNLDRNVYVRIQGSKIPRFAQKLLEIEQESVATPNFQVHYHHIIITANPMPSLVSHSAQALGWENVRNAGQSLTSQDR